MSGSQKIQVRLSRDSFSTPWGFRLQGGRDLNQALSVQRVFSNSPAEGELQRGDVIIQIGGKAGQELTHKQAQDCIKFGGGSIDLIVQRQSAGRAQSAPTSQVIRTSQPRAPTMPQQQQQQSHGGFQPKKVTMNKYGGGGPDFGSDFGRGPGYMPPQRSSAPTNKPLGPQSGMLNRVQETLDNIVLSPRTPDMYQPSQQPSFFSPPPPQQAPMEPAMTPASKPKPKVPKPVQVSQSPNACQFGIDYNTLPRRPDGQRSQAPRPMSQEVVQCEQTAYAVNETPVWRESLKTSGVRPWDMDLDFVYKKPEVRSAPYNPIPSPPPAEVAPITEPFVPTQTQSTDMTNDEDAETRIMHLQYNSPMQLYSKHNVQEVMAGQTKQQPEVQSAPEQKSSKPSGPGAVGDRDWNESAVYRMIHEEKKRSVNYIPVQVQQQQQQQQQPQQHQQQQQYHQPPQQQQQRAHQPPQQQQQRAQPKKQQIFSPPPQPQYNMAGLDDELGVSDF